MKQFLLLLTFLTLLLFCSSNEPYIDYREEMRTFVSEIASFAREQNSEFIIIPQNGHELVVKNESQATTYLSVIDGLGQEDLFFGYEEDNIATPLDDQKYISRFLEIGKENDKSILVTDYAWDEQNIQESNQKNSANGFVSFVADSRELDRIPNSSITNENGNDINQLSEAQNFLYLLNYAEFDTKASLLDAISQTNYDLLILDPFYDKELLTPSDMALLKIKANGSKRLVISYMSIGEAADYRYYWNKNWSVGDPSWLEDENPNWEGNFKVEYWNKEWQNIIYGNESSFTQKVLNAGFDGVYLDIIDAFWYFEE